MGGGLSQFITILQGGGGGSHGNPNLYYVIYGRPLTGDYRGLWGLWVVTIGYQGYEGLKVVQVVMNGMGVTGGYEWLQVVAGG